MVGLLEQLVQGPGGGPSERGELLKGEHPEGVEVVPEDATARRYLAARGANALNAAVRSAASTPSEANFINLSLEYYRNRKYTQAVDAIRKHAHYMTAAEKALFLGDTAARFMGAA